MDNVERYSHVNIYNMIKHLNLKVFPCIYRNGHKPLIRWGKQSTSDLNIIKGWLKKWPDSYLCIALKQSRMVVVDVDNKNGKQGSVELSKLIGVGELVTYTVKTPSGGFHYYFRGEIDQYKANSLAPGVDTPVMVPIAGSKTGKGTYEAITVRPIPKVPSILKNALRADSFVKRTTDFDDDSDFDLDIRSNVEKAIEMLRIARPAFLGEGADGYTYHVACSVRDFGISLNKCIDLMLKYWYPRCEPNDKPKFVISKATHAYEYARSPIGSKTPQHEFDEYFDESLPIPLSHFPNNGPDRDWLIEDWIPKGEIISVYGAGGLGKSLLMLQMCAAIAGGKKFLDMEIRQNVPVLYVSCEDSIEELYRRWAIIAKHKDYSGIENKSNCLIWSRVDKDNLLARIDMGKTVTGPFYEVLSNELKRIKGDKVLILDTISDLFAGDENSRSSVRYFIKTVIGGLRKEHHLTAILIGHPNKYSAEYSGSSSWEQSVRARLSFLKHELETCTDYRYLKNAKANYSASGGEILVKYENGVFVKVDGIIDDTEEANLNIMMDVISDMAKAGTPVGVHHSSKPWIKNIDIKDVNGNSMAYDTKLRLIDILITEKSIERVTGFKNGENGLYPAGGGTKLKVEQ